MSQRTSIIGLFELASTPMMGPGEALRLLRNCFPELVHLFGEPEKIESDTLEPFSSYKAKPMPIFGCWSV